MMPILRALQVDAANIYIVLKEFKYITVIIKYCK